MLDELRRTFNIDLSCPGCTHMMLSDVAESDTCERQCCSTNRGFKLHVLDNNNQVAPIYAISIIVCCLYYVNYPDRMGVGTY